LFLNFPLKASKEPSRTTWKLIWIYRRGFKFSLPTWWWNSNNNKFRHEVKNIWRENVER
jgi:hypothetical protein